MGVRVARYYSCVRSPSYFALPILQVSILCICVKSKFSLFFFLLSTLTLLLIKTRKKRETDIIIFQ